jgi:hypothetical protein
VDKVPGSGGRRGGGRQVAGVPSSAASWLVGGEPDPGWAGCWATGLWAGPGCWSGWLGELVIPKRLGSRLGRLLVLRSGAGGLDWCAPGGCTGLAKLAGWMVKEVVERGSGSGSRVGTALEPDPKLPGVWADILAAVPGGGAWLPGVSADILAAGGGLCNRSPRSREQSWRRPVGSARLGYLY